MIHAYSHEVRAIYSAVIKAAGITPKTTTNLIARYTKYQDVARDRRSDAVSKKGRSSKKTELVTKSVDDILEISPCLSLSQIRTLVNDETLRWILIDGDYDIPTEEQTLFSPLESDHYLSDLTENDMIKYQRFAINSDSTIHSYLRRTIYSYKRVVPEKLSFDDKPTMAKRLLCVQSLTCRRQILFRYDAHLPEHSAQLWACKEKQMRCC